MPWSKGITQSAARQGSRETKPGLTTAQPEGDRAMADSVLITPRRNFLVRALGFTAAGAALAVPIVTVASAEERLEHHLRGAVDAYRDLFPGVPVIVRGNAIDGLSAASYGRVLNSNPGNKALLALTIIGASEGWADADDRRA